MRKIKIQKIVGNLQDKLRKLYSNGKVIYKFLAFLELQKILGNFPFPEQIFYRKQSLGAPGLCRHLIFFYLDEQFYFTTDFSKDGKLQWRSCYLLGPLYDGHDHFGGFRRQGKMDHNYFIENFTESKREETKRKIKLILDALVRVKDITYVNVMGQSSWEISLRSKRLSSRKYF